MADFVGPAIEVGKCIAEPIKRQFNYLCCFNNNIRNLRDEAKKLDDAKVGVEGRVDAARRNAEVIEPQFETWLDDVNKIQSNMRAIEPEIVNVESCSLAIKSRFLLSRKATKMGAAMKELQDDLGKFGQISHPAPPAAMASIPLGQTYELESRKHVEEDIMTTLRQKKMRVMGISGMGGVGKTTMAKKIMSRARGEDLFAEIIMVVVSQPVDMLRIQKDMAEYLSLKLEVESIPARAHLLRTRLMNTRSILIILDDLWKKLNLEDLGIPDQRDLKECTILLTSRDTDVFIAMNVDKSFQMKTLEDVEAWSLFKEKVGPCVVDPSLFATAQEIVGECKGLPIALVTVGEALKDKTNAYIWKDAVQELRSCNPQDIPDFLAQVYNPLKLSYDLLESEHAKSIFLMCCLFPEDHNISIGDLGDYAWGLGMYEGITSLQVARNKVQTLVAMLKSRSLLLDGIDDGYAKMHDVVRDVAIFIAGKKGLINPNLSWKNLSREESGYNINCNWISFFDADRITLPGESVFPNLRFLLIEGPHIGFPLCDKFFESARKLHVLSIQCNDTCRSLLHTMQCLKHLRTLIVFQCYYLEDISIVGELVSLEILSCRDCLSIRELPEEIGRLNQLKLLDISNCFRLNTIVAGVISRLIRLEELTLINSFNKWESGSSGGKNARLCELNSLSSLTTLGIQIEDATLAAEQIHLSSNLVEFKVEIGYPTNQVSSTSLGREMRIKLERETIIGDWIHQLLRTTECLALKGEGTTKLVQILPEFQSLKQLFISGPVKMTRLSDGRSSGVFPPLELLSLYGIDDLEEIQMSPFSLNSFKNLQELSLENLPKLQHFWNDDLLQLKTLSIRQCSMLEQVVLWNKEENLQRRNSRRIIFPKLEELFLYDIPRLTSFCKGIQSVEFPLLTKMEVQECPNLKNLVSSTDSDHNKCSGTMTHDDDDSLPFFCKSEVAFGRLKKLSVESISSEISRLWCNQIFYSGLVDLEVSNCGSIKSLFSPLVNLERFVIKSCSMLEVLWNEEDKRKDISSCNHPRVTFPKLEELYVVDLPRLTSFCKGFQGIEFPLLTSMTIVKCPNLKSLVSSAESDFTKCSDDDSLHLFCKPNQAAFGRLESLIIGGYESVSFLWCDKIPVDFFTGLVDLSVLNCVNIKSLFSPTIAVNFVNLIKLRIKSCNEITKVIEDKVDEVGRSPFINLKVLSLEELPMLKVFCDWSCVFELLSLREVYISECSLMDRFSFRTLTSPISFKNLERIEIMSCPKLEQVMLWNEEENGKDISAQSRITFQKLDCLCLDGLSRLTSFCKGIQSIEFPILKEMRIAKCPKLKSLVSPAENDKRCSDDSLHLFCKSQVAFGRLELLKIDGCDGINSSLWCDLIPTALFNGLIFLDVHNCGNIQSLFSPSIAGNLVNLNQLSIKRCCEMVKVIEDEEEVETRSPFINLATLKLKKLPKLKTFCDWRCALHLPSLTEVHIFECPEMEKFSFGSITTPKLDVIVKNMVDISGYAKDLNDALFGGDFLHLEILFGTDQ